MTELVGRVSPKMANFLHRNFVLVTMLMCGVAIAVGGFAFASQSSIVTQNCQQIEKLKTVVRQVISHSAYDLGRRGTAGYAYYRAHPAELHAARTAALAELAEFSPQSCH